jgi:N-acetylglucosamine PTS system EIICBA or EIICB component
VQALKRLGARGVVQPGPNTLQVVVGATADLLASEIRAGLPAESARAITELETSNTSAVSAWRGDAAALLRALGGRANVHKVDTEAGSRLRLNLADSARLDVAALKAVGVRAVAYFPGNQAHLIMGPCAAATRAALVKIMT